MPGKKKKKKPKWVCKGVISGLGSDHEQFTFLQPPDPIDEKPEQSLEEGGCSSPVNVDSSSECSMEEVDKILELDLEHPPSSSPVRLTSGEFQQQSSTLNSADALILGEGGALPPILPRDTVQNCPRVQSTDLGQ
ncbi:hypothetical protein Dimus_020625, partial [Dionaea muscipula]